MIFEKMLSVDLASFFVYTKKMPKTYQSPTPSDDYFAFSLGLSI